ncbi:MAG: hypothetical protein ACTSXT_16540 [Candidatus Helarchaeota archaeon]
MKQIKILLFGQLEELNNMNNLKCESIDSIPDHLDNNTVLIITSPKEIKKNKLEFEQARIIFDFILGGGKAIFIVSPIEEDLNYFIDSKIFTFFEIEPEIITKRVLLHKTNHIINIDKDYFQSNKKPANRYVHFLTNYKKFDSEEILIEGEFEPVYYIYHEGKGAAIFYGLGVDEFKKEKVSKLIKYLFKDFSFYWKETNYDVELFRMIYNNADNKEELLQDYIKNFIRNKTFRDITLVKDEIIKLKLINSIDEHFLRKSFDELTPIQLEKQYKTIFRQMNKKKYRKFINIAQRYLIKRIGIDKYIPLKIFNRLYDADILPEEASSLIIFYLDPKNENEKESYLRNLKELIEWNKYLKIFDDRKLKSMRSKLKNKF